MVVNLLGECDKRPVLYTLIKLFQTLGDVLVVSDDPKIMRLADDNGHYQNTMIAYTSEGIDEFFVDFPYNKDDFEWTIIVNIPTADADLFLYVKSLLPSEDEQTMLEYLDEYETLELFKPGVLDKSTPYRVEQFEAYRNMPPMSPGVVNAVCTVLSKHMNKDVKTLAGIATVSYPAPAGSHSEKSLPIPKFSFKKGGGKR